MSNATSTGTIRLQSDSSSLTAGVAKSNAALQQMDAVLRRSGPALGDMSKAAKGAALGTDLLTGGVLGAVKSMGPWGLVIGVAADALIGYIAQTEQATKITREFWQTMRDGIAFAQKTAKEVENHAVFTERDAAAIKRATGETESKIRAMEVEIARTKGLGEETYELEKAVSALRVESLLAKAETELYLETAAQAAVRRAELFAEARKIEREQELADAEHEGRVERAGIVKITVKKRTGGRRKEEEKPVDLDFAGRGEFDRELALAREAQAEKQALREQDERDWQTMDERFALIMEQRQEAAEAAKEAAHQRELERIAAEQQAREEQLAQQQRILDAATGYTQQAVAGIVSIADARNAARRSAQAQGKSEAEVARAVRIAEMQARAARMQSIRDVAAMEAIRQLGMGIGALGITWGIPNPSSIAHFAAAGVLGGLAGAAHARSNTLSDQAAGMERGGGGLGGSGFGAPSSSGGGGGGGSGRQSIPGAGSQVPGSPVPQPQQQQQAPPARTVIYIQGNVIGDRQHIDDLARRIEERQHSRPRRAG